ncbi:MAG: hypothetical protein KGR19_01710 [Acidobacteria bacterium]|nr:hypothetical protein [Solirubrobacteraceae bacterium]MBU6336513.1 hypothetical protein [Acidobacteriota bacterium]
MARLPVRSVYWMLAAQAGVIVADHLRRLDAEDRAEALRILRDSKGLPNRMDETERRRLVTIARKIDHRALLADLAPLGSTGARSWRR